ncbi:UNVERIFIED_CONTAM: hypothetical protein GTU68_000543 [Idotea baltica]|nr:hypothetical protein [Idotea baltica]
MFRRKECVEPAKRTRRQRFVAAIHMPTSQRGFTILVSPHVNKEARDQVRNFAAPQAVRLDIVEPQKRTVDAFDEA